MSCGTSFFRLCRVVVFVLCALLLAVLGAQSSATGEEKGNISTADKTKPDFGLLKGRWMRNDGGYILSVKDVDPAGKMDAAYYNPRPINVSKAQTIAGRGNPESLYRAAGCRLSRIDLHADL